MKKGKPAIPLDCELIYRQARNSLAKQAKFHVMSTALTKYKQFNEHFIPRNLQVNISSLIQMLNTVLTFVFKLSLTWSHNTHKTNGCQSNISNNYFDLFFFQVRVPPPAVTTDKAYRVLWDSIIHEYEIKLLELQIDYACQMCTKYQDTAKHAFDKINSQMKDKPDSFK